MNQPNRTICKLYMLFVLGLQFWRLIKIEGLQLHSLKTSIISRNNSLKFQIQKGKMEKVHSHLIDIEIPFRIGHYLTIILIYRLLTCYYFNHNNIKRRFSLKKHVPIYPAVGLWRDLIWMLTDISFTPGGRLERGI